VKRQPPVTVMIVQQPPEPTPPHLEAQVPAVDWNRLHSRKALEEPEQARAAFAAASAPGRLHALPRRCRRHA
jgi:hypothetical protein